MTWSEGNIVDMYEAIDPPDYTQLWYHLADGILLSAYADYAMTPDGKHYFRLFCTVYRTKHLFLSEFQNDTPNYKNIDVQIGRASCRERVCMLV